MKKIFIALFITYSFILTPLCQAKNSKAIELCKSKTDNSVDYSVCLDQVKEKAEKELMTWFNNQIFILEDEAKSTGRHAALKIFKRAQKNFEKYREDNCRWQYIAYGTGNKALPVYKECYIQLTQQRSFELSQLGK